MKNLPEWMKLVKGSIDEGDDNEEVELMISEPIGFNPETYNGISADYFGRVLSSIPKGRPVCVSLNTMGGNVPEGMAMHNMMLARGNVNTKVVGYAASMGAVIFQAGNKRTMMPGTMLVIHNPLTTMEGDYRDAKDVSNFLKDVKDSIVNLLNTRTKAGKKAISDMMDATTSMGPEEAKRLGFCDEVVTTSNTWNNFDLNDFLKSYRQLSNKVAEGNKQQTNKKRMSKLTNALAKLKLIPSADLEDDAASLLVENSIGALISGSETAIAERDTLKASNEKFIAAQKLRVENRVAKAIADKKVTEARKDALIAIGVNNESALDFLDDIQVPTVVNEQRRGAPPLKTTKTGTEDKNQELENVRADMASCQDPAERGRLALRCRELRGHAELFAKK